jgi:aspartyl aminopeptidase
MAHARHPGFATASDPHSVPVLNKGLALKSGAQGNYAIDRASEAWFTAACEEAGVPLQGFMYRVGHRGGSSVGPLVSGAMGLRGVDVGAPMLAMHSIRELAGARDVALSSAAFAALFTCERPVEPVDA